MLEFLEFEEQVGRRWHRWASSAASYTRYPDAAVSLESLRSALGVFFRLSGGAPGLALSTIGERGSQHRLSLRQRLGLDQELLALGQRNNESLQLPVQLDYFPDPALNRAHYFWLSAYLAVAGDSASSAGLRPLHRDLLYLREAHRTTTQVCEYFPGLHKRYNLLTQALLAQRPRRKLPPAEAAIEACIRHMLGAKETLDERAGILWQAICHQDVTLDTLHQPRGYRPPLPVPLWGEVVDRGGGQGASPDQGEDEEQQEHPAAEASAGQRKAERRTQDQSERDDPLLLNRFEKILTWTEMVNVNRMVEDEEIEQAKKASEQIEEITLSPHSRNAATRLKVELDLASAEVDLARLHGPLCYPEWHYRKQHYLPHHTRVIPAVQKESDSDWQPDEATRRRIRQVRRQFEALRPQRTTLRGQLDGEEMDTDALVRARCDLHATGHSSDRIYLQSRQLQRDLSVAILIDVSLSTDAWLKHHRVLDVEKEALQALAHGLAACGDDYGIYSFTSHRRHQVWVNTIKAFTEPMDERISRRIDALRPGHYTRMGAGIRHITRILRDRPSRKRLLLVLTDGKPNDTDHYEGRYGLEDTRKAILEARRDGITVFGVTIDDNAQHYFPYLFGPGAYSIVGQPARLGVALPGIYRHLVEQ